MGKERRCGCGSVCFARRVAIDAGGTRTTYLACRGCGRERVVLYSPSPEQIAADAELLRKANQYAWANGGLRWTVDERLERYKETQAPSGPVPVDEGLATTAEDAEERRGMSE